MNNQSNNICSNCKHESHPLLQCVECYCDVEKNIVIPPADPTYVSDDASKLNQVRLQARSLGLEVGIEGRNVKFIRDGANTTVHGVALAIVFLRGIEFVTHPHRFGPNAPTHKWMDEDEEGPISFPYNKIPYCKACGSGLGSNVICYQCGNDNSIEEK